MQNCLEPKVLISQTCPDGSQTPYERVYTLYRGRLDRADMMTVDRYGVIINGYLKGRTLREVLQTAAREGGLAYRQRPDGWYSAEWAEGRIALCGPVRALPSTHTVELLVAA
jgi:hypothetical protein